jgi:P-type Cu+ transporter
MERFGVISKSALMGVIGTISLLGIYFLILTLVSGWTFALSQFFEFWHFVVSLAIGFGIQIGLYGYLRKAIHQHCASAKVLAVSGTTSTTAMISCCAHYLANIMPAVGAAGIITLVGQYQIQLFWFGLASNAAGILYMGSRVIKFVKTHGGGSPAIVMSGK